MKKEVKRIRLPEKNSINFALVGKKPLNLKIAVPAVILIVAAAAVLSKFAVIDRFVAVAKAEAEVNSLQQRVNDGYATIAGYDELLDKYAHYTYKDMTDEELNRIDRIEIITMLDRAVFSKVSVRSWSVSSNVMLLSVTADTLEEINAMMQGLSNETIVDYCTINSASTAKTIIDTEVVNAQISVYLTKRTSEVNG